MTVLILATERDISADRMVRALDDRDVPVFRADLSWFPQELTLDRGHRADGDAVLIPIDAASQISSGELSRPEKSSHPVSRKSPEVMCRMMVPSRRMIACTTPLGSSQVSPAPARYSAPGVGHRSPRLGRYRSAVNEVLPGQPVEYALMDEAVNGGALGREFSFHD